MDKEKGKYFRIEKNNLAPPAGSKYSKQSVEDREKQEKKRKRDILHDHNIKTQRIRRPRVLEHPLLGGTRLKQEIGEDTSSGSVRESMGKAWIQGLRASILFEVGSVPPNAKIVSFVVDPQTQLVYAGMDCTGGPLQSLTSVVYPLRPTREGERNLYQQAIESIIPEQYESFTTSLCFRASAILSTTCPVSASRSIAALAPLPDVHKIESSWPWLQPDVTEVFSHSQSVFWCSAAAPSSISSTPPVARVDFVCGTSTAISFVVSETGDRNRATCVGVVSGLVSDVLAVEWLSSTQFVAGQRNGTVSLFELHSLDDIYASHRVMRLGVWRHPKSIVKITKVDERRILVTGLDGRMHMYDIRDIHRVNDLKSLPGSVPVSRPYQYGALPPISLPHLTFPAYQNRYTRNLGLDVDVELGIVATASDDNRILFFSLYTGQLILCSVSKKKYADPITCIRFQKSSDGTLRLMFCHDRTLEELAW